MLAGNKLLRARVRVSSIRSNRTGDHTSIVRNSPENEITQSNILVPRLVGIVFVCAEQFD